MEKQTKKKPWPALVGEYLLGLNLQRIWYDIHVSTQNRICFQPHFTLSIKLAMKIDPEVLSKTDKDITGDIFNIVQGVTALYFLKIIWFPNECLYSFEDYLVF